MKSLQATVEAAVIRKASPEDAEGIKRVVDEFRFQGNGEGKLIPLTLQQILDVISKGSFYVADAAGKIVGCNSVVEYGIAEMRSWAVLPGYQGNGIGTKLVEAGIAHARSRGHKAIYTLTQEGNFAKLEKLGFAKTGKPPAKLARDCEECPIRDKCNETAYVRKL